jgi:hypothetical protein
MADQVCHGLTMALPNAPVVLCRVGTDAMLDRRDSRAGQWGGTVWNDGLSGRESAAESADRGWAIGASGQRNLVFGHVKRWLGGFVDSA